APPGPPGSGPAKKGLPTWAWVAIGCGGIMLLGLIALVVLGVFIFSWGRGALEDATGERSLSDIVESLEDNPARTIAETAIRMNSELELISTDDDAGTITFRSSETGEEATLNFQDIAEGRFAMTTPDGDFSVDAAAAAGSAAAAAVDAVGAVGNAGGGVTFSGPDGQVRLGANISLDELPDWVPVYPGSSDAQVPYMTSTDEGASGMLSGTTADSVQQVVDHYRDVFDDNGFTIANESTTQSGTTELASITATSDDGTVNAAATRQAGEDTQIVVMFAATDGR
ncbi:MAG: hypothetical protein ABGY72_08360, partial [bacterium]